MTYFMRDSFEGEDFDKVLDMRGDGDSDEEPRGGSRAGRSANIERDPKEEASQLFSNYCADPTYPAHVFKRRFCVPRAAFTDICEALQSKTELFITKKDDAGKVGFNVYQKRTAEMRQFAYSTCSDAVDKFELEIVQLEIVRTPFAHRWRCFGAPAMRKCSLAVPKSIGIDKPFL